MSRVPPLPRLNARPTPAFTLVELLTVIAIIGILSAIFVPVVSKVRENAQNSACISNLRQIGTAFQLYVNDNRGLFPAPRQADSNNPSANQNPRLGPWQLELAPYVAPKLVAENMYRLKDSPADQNAAFCPSYVRLFPSQAALRDTGLNALGYGMNFELNVDGTTLNTQARRVTRFRANAITSPASQILVGDSGDYHIFLNNNTWVVSQNAKYPDGYGSGAPTRHGDHANYLFADLHVSSLPADIAVQTLRFHP